MNSIFTTSSPLKCPTDEAFEGPLYQFSKVMPIQMLR